VAAQEGAARVTAGRANRLELGYVVVLAGVVVFLVVTGFMANARCAQLCGLDHFDMDFYVQAVPPAAFANFLRTGRT
jgi:hypothetical protein